MFPTLGPIARGQHKHWALVASVLEHKSDVGATLVKVVFLLLILCFTHCFSIIIPFAILKHVPAAKM
jgi:hypothetical protein